MRVCMLPVPRILQALGPIAAAAAAAALRAARCLVLAAAAPRPAGPASAPVCKPVLALGAWPPAVTMAASTLAQQHLVVVGGGASGMFAATAAARRGIQVTVLEQGAAPLRKLLASGGGRCNVMHEVQPPRHLVSSYPRGERELLGPFTSHFSPHKTRDWFEREGVELKVEADGRVFPVTDDAETIAGALRRAARAAGVRTILGAKVTRVAHEPRWREPHLGGARESEGCFHLDYLDKRAGRSNVSLRCSALLLATGSAPGGYSLARELGHELLPAYPSLFSFRVPGIERSVLGGLAGVVLPEASLALRLDDAQQQGGADRVTVPAQQRGRRRQRGAGGRGGGSADGGRWLTQRGSLLVTHRGLSGPAALRLSAFGARQLCAAEYRGSLLLNTVDGAASAAGVVARQSAHQQWCLAQLRSYAEAHTAQKLVNARSKRPFEQLVPKRWWVALVSLALADDSSSSSSSSSSSIGRRGGGHDYKRWADVRSTELEKLSIALTGLSLEFVGKDTNKEEFVSAGGVRLSDVDLRTMESRVVPGLHFAGELLDIDGVTGGFNFQAAWTTGHIAGEAAAVAAAAVAGR
jgi:predicted flavoprotein YhiN